MVRRSRSTWRSWCLLDEDPGGGYEGTRDCGICLPPWYPAHGDDRACNRVARRPERGARQDPRPDEPGTRDADRTQRPDAGFPGLERTHCPAVSYVLRTTRMSWCAARR